MNPRAAVVLRGVLTTAAVLVSILGCGHVRVPDGLESANAAGRLPALSPDYAGIVIPPNIAPLDFRVREPGCAYFVRISSSPGNVIELLAADGCFLIPAAKWKTLLDAGKGSALRIEVFVKDLQGAWTSFDAIENTIAEEPIDSHLAYRRMVPWYHTYDEIGIYQRNLESFEEKPILKNSDFSGHAGEVCINCHAFPANQPDRMTIHARFPFVMLLARDGEAAPLDTRTDINKSPFAYTAWHPSGRWAVYSVNKILQVFHTIGETRDVLDFASDLLIYDFEKNTVTAIPEISRPDQLETFPAWSPDGRCLYFCRTAVPAGEPMAHYREVKYDLARIQFDPDAVSWGTVETVLSAADTGRSAGLPRVSPDGRHLLFCLCDYGTFPIFQTNSDLYMLDIETHSLERLACNSDASEAWHSWSANGHWIVFSSKRCDGLFARPYFSYIDASGHASKAFVLPQKDPAYYDAFAETYSAPELTQGAVTVSREALANALRHSEEAANVMVDPEALKSRHEDTGGPAPGYGNQS
jgi:hypothetical protein